MLCDTEKHSTVHCLDEQLPQLLQLSQQQQQQPVIVTESKRLEVAEQKSVQFDCQVQHLGRHSVVWQRGKRVLTAKRQVIDSDRRLQILANYSLLLTAAGRRDAGRYTCSVTTNPVTQITHTLVVLYGPRVAVELAAGSRTVTAQVGNNASVKCSASGNPAPTVFWQKQGGFLPDGKKRNYGSLLQAYKISRQMAGTYECVADNGIGPAQRVTVTLLVQYPPEVSVTSSHVFSGEGQSAHLSCFVNSDPSSDVLWSRSDDEYSGGGGGGGEQFADSRWKVLASDDKANYTLIIGRVRAADFGTYLCTATNALGSAQTTIMLSGVPERPVILSASGPMTPDRYRLQWQVKSSAEITNFRVEYRNNRTTETNESVTAVKVGWKEVEVPAKGSATNSSDLYRQTIMLSPLQPNAAYQVAVSAANRHGWSDRSAIHHFTTAARGAALESRHPNRLSAGVNCHRCQMKNYLAALVLIMHYCWTKGDA